MNIRYYIMAVKPLCLVLMFFAIHFGCTDRHNEHVMSINTNSVDTSEQKVIRADKHVRKPLVVYIYHTKGVNRNDLKLADSVLRKFYQARVVFKGEYEIPNSCINTSSKRVNANEVIKLLAGLYPNERGKRLLITNRIISTNRVLNGKTYPDYAIMGLGSIGGRGCVISTSIIKTNKVSRLTKVILHEIGHTLGADHCKFSETCLMTDLKGKGAAIDRNSFFMCAKCQAAAVVYH